MFLRSTAHDVLYAFWSVFRGQLHVPLSYEFVPLHCVFLALGLEHLELTVAGILQRYRAMRFADTAARCWPWDRGARWIILPFPIKSSPHFSSAYCRKRVTHALLSQASSPVAPRASSMPIICKSKRLNILLCSHACIPSTE